MTKQPVDLEAAAQAVRQLLVAIGEDPDREGLADTPMRVAKSFEEMTSGLHIDPAKHLETRFNIGHDEVVLVRDITFHSLCEHHLLPFFGKAHVAYLPADGQVTGLSKLARVVDGYARRPQVQERLTMQIADAIEEKLSPRGCAVVIEAEHLCMTVRGVAKPGASTVTSALRGAMRNNPATRAEVLALIAPAGGR
ncbi:GTP cyclohydrolase I FolE [Boudabousia liubingyangii]|uniref:GTP cyclohydrolase 1 n=1 Tax=Boudabousia liubingyangii TaxID=1921764 RepID=A0A1Q5PLN5_9ACTO|nr:GTP cyclohydrolase I FolE [Boudabousia liubingyangii]OKL47975.1 GTP cyclohydrolase I FolE [Boudabousia liubingyangii]